MAKGYRQKLDLYGKTVSGFLLVEERNPLDPCCSGNIVSCDGFHSVGAAASSTSAIRSRAVSSTFQERRDSLTPVLIRLANYGVAVNVTVKYSARKQVTSLWWLNGNLVVDGDDGVRTEVNYIYYTTEYNGVRRHLKTASIRIPSAFNVETLQIQFAGKSIDVTISINVVTIASGKSLLEYIPKYEYKVTPNYRVTYNPGDSLSFRSSFKSKDLVRSTWDGFKVEFTSIDDCISPPIIQIKTAESDPEFLAVHTPRREDVYLHYWDYIYVGNPKYKIRYLNVTYNSSGDLPRGILKLTNGYSFTRSCQLLAGMKVTYMLFLTPASDSYFFAEKAVVLDKGERNYYAENGGEVDVLLKAIGGSEVSEIWDEPLYEYPDIRLSRKNQTIEPVADIQRFFERKVYFRFRPVTPEQAGRYLVVATMRSPNGTGTAKANLNINVLNVC
ncbi:uncharacterized protein LOC124145524 [Haliotis rufescens]|uniref:uncharacterized protein LOC124145524 n=1 Tax=Haliotis rufescens TaxID=6454 RepID=UPI00201ED4BB|nr:uncharacterized protein LOC124145524 [Haliotis rufescens]